MPPDPTTKGVTRLGKYEVVKHLATGGMGAVYKARDVETGREVALKILSKELASKPAVVERFRREAGHASKLDHENIVSLYDWGEIDNVYFLALEFVKGIDLSEYIRRKGKLGIEESRQIIIQATRALCQLHERGIVHRDIKPANFMISPKDGKPFIKLIDLGLAREIDSDQFRITRASFTLGTIDYMSPEQARDSGRADIRSDIYSLGCTWYQMLAGRPPFPDGSLTERLYKHIETPAPDIREFNRKVPAGLAAVLAKMLLKDPEDRYQSPAELLQALENPSTSEAKIESDTLAQLAEGEPEEKTPKATRERTSTDSASRVIKKKNAKKTQGQKYNTRWIAIGGVVGLLVVAGVVALIVFRRHPQETSVLPSPLGLNSQTTPAPVMPTRLFSGPQSTRRTDSTKAEVVPPQGTTLPPLYKQVFNPIKPVELWEQAERPFPAIPPQQPPSKILQVSRAAKANGGNLYDSLDSALASLEEKEAAAIEIHDNGPLFELPASVVGHNLVIRAAKGYRPMLAWDWQNPVAKSSTFVTVSHGNLTIENLDLVLKCSDSGPPEPATFFQVNEGSFEARDCTVSVSGQHRSGITVVRLESANREDPTPARCRLDRCCLRGSEITALDLKVPVVDMMLNGCLIVGGDRPLIRFIGRNAPVPRSILEVIRSTLVCGKTLLQVRPTSAVETSPAVNWFGWDALLAHSGPGGGELLGLLEGADTRDMRWQALNCYYPGWKTLLSSPTQTSVDLMAWRTLWHMDEGEVTAEFPWPIVPPSDPGQTSPTEFRTQGTEASFAATSGPGALGCNVTAWPTSRNQWLPYTYDLFLPGPLALPAPGPAPPGERLQLAAGVDLGAFLQRLSASHKPGSTLVIHLTGNGDQPTSPIHLKGFNLVLEVDHPVEEKPPFLTLVPREQTLVGQMALIDVEDGSLEIRGASIRFPDLRADSLSSSMVRVQNGSLGIFNCRLQGPISDPPSNYQELITIGGPVKPIHEQAHGCVVKDSVLISNPTCIRLQGTGLQLHVGNSLMVAGADAFHLSPGLADKERLDIQCLVDHTTVAAHRAALHLDDNAALGVPSEPCIFQAQSTTFLNPFREPPQQGGLLIYEEGALQHGLVVWQGVRNYYDRRLHFGVLPAQGTVPKESISHPAWVRLWGTPGDRQPFPDFPMVRTIDFGRAADLETIPLDVLVPPSRPQFPSNAGADLVQLGIGKKMKFPR